MADASFAENHSFHIASEDAIHALIHRVFCASASSREIYDVVARIAQPEQPRA